MPTRPFEGVESQRELHTIELGCILQRLFSAFPSSWPGVGLLLLRLCLAASLLHFTDLSGSSDTIVFAQGFMAAGGGFLLLAGLWTPLVATLVALDEVWIALSHYSPQKEHTWIHFILVIFAVSVAMLGPGAFSIDARLFGRKRFDFDRRRAT